MERKNLGETQLGSGATNPRGGGGTVTRKKKGCYTGDVEQTREAKPKTHAWGQKKRPPSPLGNGGKSRISAEFSVGKTSRSVKNPRNSCRKGKTLWTEKKKTKCAADQNEKCKIQRENQKQKRLKSRNSENLSYTDRFSREKKKKFGEIPRKATGGKRGASDTDK